MQLGCIAQGLLQYLAIEHTAAVWRNFGSWLRTMNLSMPPSEPVVASALRSTLWELLAVPSLAPDLAKILLKYRRCDPPPETEQVRA